MDIPIDRLDAWRRFLITPGNIGFSAGDEGEEVQRWLEDCAERLRLHIAEMPNAELIEMLGPFINIAPAKLGLSHLCPFIEGHPLFVYRGLDGGLVAGGRAVYRDPSTP